MKKILALTVSGILALGGIASLAACKTATDVNGTVYLIPGTYMSEGVKVENTVGSGANKLSDEKCVEISTENAYVCTLAKGAALPTPSSSRQDGDGNAFEFNGWWTIVDATVTYYETVPEVTQTTFLYADWRAPLSQPMDPIVPDGYVEVEANHYLAIKRASDESDDPYTEKVTLRATPSDMSTAEWLDYNYPVELFTQGFELYHGDVIYVYTTGLDSTKEEATLAPVLATNGCKIELSASGDGSNDTADFLSAYAPTTKRTNPYLTYKAEASGTFNIYIKFFMDGNKMSVYMEPSA